MIVWSPGVSLETVERQVIQEAYTHYQKVKTTTAAALGIAVRTLDEKLKRYEADEQAVEERAAKAEIERIELRERHRFGTNARQGEDLFKEDKLEAENEARRQRYARERSEGTRATVEVAGGPKGAARLGAAEGLPVEPAAGPATERPLSVPERREVQEVLPSKVAANGPRRGR